jgi:hypothetical protein
MMAKDFRSVGVFFRENGEVDVAVSHMLAEKTNCYHGVGAASYKRLVDAVNNLAFGGVGAVYATELNGWAYHGSKEVRRD